MQLNRLCFVLAATLLIFSLQAQEYYRWQDQNGQLHVSQVPPPAGMDYEIWSLDPKQPPQQVKAEPSNKVPSPAPITKQQVKALQQQVQQVNAQLKVQNCTQARENKQRLEAEAPVAFNDTDGKPVPLNAEMRAEQLKIAERHIAEFCQSNTSN